MTCKFNALVLGDFHFRKAHYELKTSTDKADVTLSSNTKCTWKCSKWMTVHSAKKEYFKYKKEHGTPDIVILAVGNNDLAKASSECSVITYLLRTMKMLRKDGVIAVWLCALTERNLPISTYNEQVEKVNKILMMQAKYKDYVFFFRIVEKDDKNDLVTLFMDDGKNLTKPKSLSMIQRFVTALEDEKFMTHLNKEKNEKIAISANQKKKKNKTKKLLLPKGLFKDQLVTLNARLQLVKKEKDTNESYVNTLNEQVDILATYISKLESFSG